MINLYGAVRLNPTYSKLQIGGFLFAEYTCGVTATKLPAWTETDYLVHVVTGRKTWHTADGIWRANPGDTLFFKKGATIVEQHFEHDVCLLMLFIPDILMRSAVREVTTTLPRKLPSHPSSKTAVRVASDVTLQAFFQSLRTYLAAKEKPPEPLLRLKLKELVFSILSTGVNDELAAYFQRIGQSDAPALPEMMEANFRYNLSLCEYARLCHRSLSSFKREFHAHFAEPPGKWLQKRRLELASTLLRSSDLNVTEVAFESGFLDLSHFSRAFKERFGVPPLAYRQDCPVAA